LPFIIVFISAVVPVLSITKLKPIDAIKSIN
jgi:ABC-type antimicrobial peptide transport system permease subunit